jgi:serine/threonine-protein kinase
MTTPRDDDAVRGSRGDSGSGVDPDATVRHGPDTLAQGSTPDFKHGRFEPGERLGSRYRLVGLLGKGGMGEVYRADDLDLGQSVALKFLPARVAADAAWLARFRNEVRTAREVTHPNVCRIHDIAEEDGHVFISMEYIDGEDMGSVLRRLGRPSGEKALEIARQICLGLAAAHESGVLHRDLKPANIMIDGRGRVRITDFGLAGFFDELEGVSAKAGTPAYMAPEQLDHGEVSVRSDVYSLGLILYELFTGRSVFDTDDIAELKDRHSRSSTSLPSSIVTEVDPVVESVVMRCLQEDPAQRPASVYAVLGALPGSDPLAAALAAGETPSPHLVAGATQAGALRPAVAMACLVTALVNLVAAVWLSERATIYSYVPLDVPESELAVRARDALQTLGHEGRHDALVSGFYTYNAATRYVEELDDSPERWERLRDLAPPAVIYWYRIGDLLIGGSGAHNVAASNWSPPIARPGEGIVELDPSGRLFRLTIVPRSAPPDPEAERAPRDHRPILEMAGLDPDAFEPTDLARTPEVACDVHAWSGPYRALAEPVVVQIGWHGDAVHHFRIVGPWSGGGDATEAPAERDVSMKVMAGVMFGLIMLVVLTVCAIAYRNLRDGRSDRAGAFRVALVVIATMWIGEAIAAGVPGADPIGSVFETIWGAALAHGLLHGALIWLLYLALEPYARRVWPRSLVSWTRVLMGRFRDPQVGRDILVGGVAFGVLSLLFAIIAAVSDALGHPRPAPGPMPATGLTQQIGHLVRAAGAAVNVPFLILALLMVARLVLRRQIPAIVACIAIPIVVAAFVGPGDATDRAIGAASAALYVGTAVFIALRFGVWALIVGQALIMFMGSTPVTLDLSRWYAVPALLPVLVYAALLVYGAWISMAGRPLFGDLPPAPGHATA